MQKARFGGPFLLRSIWASVRLIGIHRFRRAAIHAVFVATVAYPICAASGRSYVGGLQTLLPTKAQARNFVISILLDLVLLVALTLVLALVEQFDLLEVFQRLGQRVLRGFELALHVTC